MNDWDANIDAEEIAPGIFVPVLILIPPVDIGPPVRRRMEGHFPSAEQARVAAVDALAAMSLKPPED